MITDFQAGCKAEMSCQRSQLVLPLTGGRPREPLSNAEFIQILQLIHTRDTAVIAEGLLRIKTLAEPLKMQLHGYSSLVSLPGGYTLPTPPLSLTVSSAISDSPEPHSVMTEISNADQIKPIFMLIIDQFLSLRAIFKIGP